MRNRAYIQRKAKRICSLALGMFLMAGSIPARAEIEIRETYSAETVEEKLAESELIDDEFLIEDELIDEGFLIEDVELATDSNASLIGDEAPGTLGRVLVQESFDNGNNWEVNHTSAVTFHDGKGHIKGSGPNNRMGYKDFIVNADNFLIELDLTINAGNTNANTKIGFKAVDYDGERLQLRFDFPNQKVYLEKTGGASVHTSFKGEIGSTYQIAIWANSDTLTAYIDGKEILTWSNSVVSQMEQGYFSISGQFPGQDFSVDNLVISTDEQVTGEEYTVTLKTATDGEEDADVSKGGTLSADKMTGYSGDTITLFPLAKHGYVFDRYTSFKADGSSTDGLMPINNHKFRLNEKFGNVTVIAHFKTRVPGRFELFYDDFGAASLNEYGHYKAIKDSNSATLDKGELVLDVNEENNYVLVDQQFFAGKSSSEGYRISVDVRRKTMSDGTMQIMFKGDDQTIADRYALVINTQGSAMFRRFGADGTNVELKKSGFSWPASGMTTIALEVKGNEVTFFANGQSMMSYTDNNSWRGLADAVGFINMTKSAPMIFDNLLVERIPESSTIDIIVKYEENGVIKEDTEFKAGTVSSNMNSVVEGDRVTLEVMEKAGWRLKEYSENNAQLVINNHTFVVPADAPANIQITAVFEPKILRDAKIFYIDSQTGEDSYEGTSEERPWKTLGRLVSEGVFAPGDKILLKRGSQFHGESLSFLGMGTKERPIIIDAYGEGESLPRLNGDGKVENVISLYNQEYIEIRNLEITNTDKAYKSDFTLNGSNNKSKALRAVNVSIKNFGIASGIVIENCYIHDINGNINLKWNGGIFFDVKADIRDGKLVGIPSKYDNILISGCTFQRVDRSAIKLVSSSWCNQWEKNSPGVPVNWYPSTNVVVRGNYMEKIGGDGITNRDTDGALIEYNLVRDCRYQNTGYNVGIWPFEASNTVIQYNEAYDTHGTTDGQGLDCDHASSYSVMQYNYSHNNEGGFMLIMGGYPHTAPTVRYNVSQNDRDKTFEFAQGIPKGTMIYNNTIYSDRVLGRGIFFLSNTAVGSGINDMYIYNNLFWYPKEQVMFSQGEIVNAKKAAKFYNNAYAGGIQAPEGETQALVLDDAGLVAPGTGPEVNQTKIPVLGRSGSLDGYKLRKDSLLIDAGVTMEEAFTYFGGTELVDGRTDSPRDLFDTASISGKKSIDYIMGNNFPKIEGVIYHVDFFGNQNQAGDKPDIGAAEFGGKSIEEPGNPEPPISPEKPEKPAKPNVPNEEKNYETSDEKKEKQNSRYAHLPETTGAWKLSEQGWEFLNQDGVPYLETWILKDGRWYWVDLNGVMTTGLKAVNGVLYYFVPETGEMAVGWIQVDGAWYYMNEDGAMLTNSVTPDGYRVDENGVWVIQ